MKTGIVISLTGAYSGRGFGGQNHPSLLRIFVNLLGFFKKKILKPP